MIFIFFVIIGLIIWVAVMLRAANRDDAPGAMRQRAQRDQADESHVIHTGRGVLVVIAVVVGMSLVLLLIILGTCMTVVPMNTSPPLP
ncbi:MAG: hypothetical protein WCP31_10275 [Chloroflexales bacterium]